MKKNLTLSSLLMLLILPLAQISAQSSTQSHIYTIYPFGDSVWAIDTSDYSIATRLGLTTSFGGTVTGGNGVAVTSDHCEMYVILKITGITGRMLAKIDPLTGVCDTVGNLGDNFAGICFTNEDRLFGITGDGANTSESLFEIDPSNGDTTLVTALGAGSDGECISYCPDNNKIYHWSGRNTNNAMHSIDPDSGTVTTINFTGFDWDEIFGAVYIGGGQFRLANLDQEWITIDTNGFAVLDSNNTTHEFYRGMALWNPGGVGGFTITGDTVCPGDTTTVTATCSTNDTVIYEWGDGSAADTAFSATHVYTNTGNRTLSQITIRNGLRDTLTFPVRVQNVPNVAINPGDTAYLCGPMDTVRLQGSGGGSSQWYLNGQAIPAADTNIYLATMPGLYNMTKTNMNGCSDSSSVGTRVIPGMPIVGSFTQNRDTVCQDSMIAFTNTSMGFDTTSWDFGDGNGAGTPNAMHSYSSTGTFTVSMTVFGNCGDSTATSTVVVIDCSVGREPGLAIPGMSLGNLPNPFSGQTRITYSVPEAGNARLRVFNTLGAEIAVLTDGFVTAGSHELDWNAENLNPGVYIYRLEYAGVSISRRMLIIK